MTNPLSTYYYIKIQFILFLASSFDAMNKVILYIFGAIFILGVLLRILFALFYPDKFAEGARKVLFIEEREKALFRHADVKQKHSKDDEDSNSDI
ncbi:MAG TPA: hypothetical protein EYP18_06255 [Desulfobacterales bacterium]|nr:hypothetical protein [Desulfobacterales bacterium]